VPWKTSLVGYSLWGTRYSVWWELTQSIVENSQCNRKFLVLIDFQLAKGHTNGETVVQVLHHGLVDCRKISICNNTI